MVVYCSMFFYVFIIGYAGKYFAKKHDIKSKYDNKTMLFFAVAVLILPVFFIGLRTNYVDTKAYISWFDGIPTSFSEVFSSCFESKGPGWTIYQWIIKFFITENANAFLMITAIIQAGALLKFNYKYSSDYAYSMLLFFLSMDFADYMMNGIRQFLALSLILYFADYIFDKKYVKFLVVVLIAYFIHTSAIIWAAAVFIIQGKPWNKKVIICVVLAVLAILFVDQFTNLLDEGLENTEYAGYSQQFSEDDGSNPMRTLIFAVPVLIAFWKRKRIAEADNKALDIMINISVIAFAISLVANFTSGILIGRMPIYFGIFNYALFPLLFDNAFDKKDGLIMKVLCAVGYMCYAVYYMLNTWGSKGMPYISDILGINTWK